ncbi:hypothetical protein [Desulfotignum phosphitoxidans]|jgi:hypothetical protein|uniref:Uncharacterized protein n=1 Tax=Desulfotignum phosphitoxidans DSM 13687 TaxID=1286635 RepID=S0FR91_9BACT|nr:hypothetical protein [Desulfotignum phosphitoxidans]EMS77185.1 hypothetical protein Dpo_22c00040 [Desulfotignum phosphitoxidans DSM 13687]
MTGSEKQIKWAEDIKRQANFENCRSQFAGNAAANKAIDWLENIENVKFWIENQGQEAAVLLTILATTGLDMQDGTTAKADTDGNVTTN